MGKLSKLLSSIAIVGLLLAVPNDANANHGSTFFWETHYSYYECLDGGYYFVQEQHRHNSDGTQDFRTIYEKVLNACPM